MTIPSIDSINVHSTTHNIMTSCLSKATATCDKKKKKNGYTLSEIPLYPIYVSY